MLSFLITKILKSHLTVPFSYQFPQQVFCGRALLCRAGTPCIKFLETMLAHIYTAKSLLPQLLWTHNTL